MAEQTTITVYVPVISDRRNTDDYAAITCGAFRNKKDALNALIRTLVDSELIFDLSDEDYHYTFRGDELKCEDNEYKIQVLCKHANTLEDVIDMCKKLGDPYYDDGWIIEVKEFQLQ